MLRSLLPLVIILECTLSVVLKKALLLYHICHHCMADPEELHTMTTENEALLRTVPAYEHQVQKKKSAKTKKKKEELSTEFGLNRECSLNELRTHAPCHWLTRSRH